MTRIGMLGCGSMGRVWTQTIATHPTCILARVFDPDAATAAAGAAAAQCAAAPSVDAVLTAADVDVVLVATPSWTHADLVCRAAAAGKHVLCEKPMALTLGDCRRMARAARDHGVQLVIGHTLRYWGAFRAVRDQVQAGAIGAPCLARVGRGGAVDRQAAAAAEAVGAAPVRWRFDTRYSGGDVLEGVIHELDFARSLFGPVATLHARISGQQCHGDWVSPRMMQASLGFVNGGQATVWMGGMVGFDGGGHWVSGTEATLRFERWEGPVWLHRPGASQPEMVPCPTDSAYALELEDLLQAITTGGRPDLDAANGQANVALGLAAYVSMATGEVVDLVDDLPVGVPDDYQYRGPSALA
jgi:predicted dehydrogenase